MLTNNYYAYKKLEFSGGTSYNGSHPENLTFKTVDGSSIGFNNPSLCTTYGTYGALGYWLNKAKCAALPTQSTYTSYGNGGVYFGTGTTPATLADYTLEKPITSGLSITNPSKYSFNDNGEGKWTYSASYVLTNTSGAEINIYEIGIITMAGTTGNSTYAPLLMERTVLTEPITIPAGGAKLVTVTVTQNNVLNVE